MWGNRMPILISDGCDDITATRNADKTYRVTAKVKVKQADGQETEATIEVERAFLHIEALESGGEFYKLIVPVEESLSVNFPKPSKDDWKMLGFSDADAKELADETCS